MENWVTLLISLVSGIVGGNVAGAALPEDKNLGALGNTIAGLFGGAAGGYIMQALGILSQATAQGASTGLDIGSILANVGASGVSGAVLMAIVGFIKNAMNKRS